MKIYDKEKLSFHDTGVLDLDYDFEKNTLRLITDYGLAIEGYEDFDISIGDISLDDSYVYILDYKNVLAGNIGVFAGEKLGLLDLITSYDSKFKRIDLTGDLHSYKGIFITGYIQRGEELLEIFIDIFYHGEIFLVEK